MTWVLIGVFAVFFLLVIAEVPIAFALLAAGTFGLFVELGLAPTTAVLANQPYTAVASYFLIVVPMFIVMGMFALSSRISNELFAAASVTLSWLPGGLAVATVAACAGFGAVTGSSIATAATVGRMSIRELIVRGYPRSFAVGVVAAGGTLGSLIPPSVVLVVFATLAGVSIADILLAAIIPGIITTLVYMAYIVFRCRRMDILTEPLPEASTGQETRIGAVRGSTLSIVVKALYRPAILFAITIGGIYAGVFTPTESAALGALAALIMMVIHFARRREAGFWVSLKDAFMEASSTTSMAVTLVVGASVFGMYMAVAGIPQTVANALAGLELPKVVVLVLILSIYLPMGMFLDGLSMIVLTVPIVAPAIANLGYDNILFGILLVKMIEIGLISPPNGLNVFVAARVSGGVTPEEGFRGSVPFILLDLCIVALLISVPSLTLWLPSLRG